MNISAMWATESPRRLVDHRRNSLPNVNEVLDLLEQMYGPQQPVGPTDPFEMIVDLNCGYPASDASGLRSWRRWPPCRPRTSKCPRVCGLAKREKTMPRITARRGKS